MAGDGLYWPALSGEDESPLGDLIAAAAAEGYSVSRSGESETPPEHFARVDFRNDDRVFGIKDEDRFLHVYVIGKTGTGKSSLIETMALQDLERGNGFALIDPHGDLVARVAARVPASQQGDLSRRD